MIISTIITKQKRPLVITELRMKLKMSEIINQLFRNFFPKNNFGKDQSVFEYLTR